MRRLSGWIGNVLLLSFVALWQPAAGLAQTETSPSEPGIRVVLVKISSYTEFQEIREMILKISGVTAVTPQSEARELITLRVGGPISSDRFIEALKTTFDGLYTITPKKLASGIMEINLSKAG